MQEVELLLTKFFQLEAPVKKLISDLIGLAHFNQTAAATPPTAATVTVGEPVGGTTD